MAARVTCRHERLPYGQVDDDVTKDYRAAGNVKINAANRPEGQLFQLPQYFCSMLQVRRLSFIKRKNIRFFTLRFSFKLLRYLNSFCILTENEPLLPQSQAAAQFQRGRALVHGVEVQAGCAASDQTLAELCDHVHAKRLNGGHIVAQLLQAQAQPAGDFRAAGV